MYMKFDSSENTEKFLNDIKFYENINCYCLGNTLEDAGEIIRKIIEEQEMTENVGMDYE